MGVKDRKILEQRKPEFGHYISADGILVPNKMEQDAIKEVRRLRRRRFSYAKISKRIEDHFETNKDSGEPNVKISHTGVYRILNPTRRATSKNKSEK
ncbi:MAG: hypothetical protein VB778_04415 [Nitrospinaceae bacterium]